MKKQIRKIHIGDQEWHYIMFCGGAKVFPPNSKSCMAEVWYDNAPHDTPDKGSLMVDGTRSFQYSGGGWRPGRLKAYIEKELAPRLTAWVAAGKPVLSSLRLAEDDPEMLGEPEAAVAKWQKNLKK